MYTYQNGVRTPLLTHDEVDEAVAVFRYFGGAEHSDDAGDVMDRDAMARAILTFMAGREKQSSVGADTRQAAERRSQAGAVGGHVQGAARMKWYKFWALNLPIVMLGVLALYLPEHWDACLVGFVIALATSLGRSDERAKGNR